MKYDLTALKTAGCVLDAGFPERAARYGTPLEVQQALAEFVQHFERDNCADIKNISAGMSNSKESFFLNCQSETFYDIASVTKVFTLKTVYELIREGAIDPEEQLCERLELPEFAGYRVLDAIKMRGSIQTRGRLSLTTSRQEFLNTLKTVHIVSLDEANTVYTDIGFILLGMLAEKVTGLSLQQAVRKYVTAPLHMYNTDFLPQNGKLLANGNSARLPHDFKTRTAGGVTGAAGLFSTVPDLLLLSKAFVRGEFFHSSFLKDIFAYSFTDSLHRVKSYAGMYLKSPPSVPTYTTRCFSEGVIGHHGFTGSNFVADLKLGVCTALLVNALRNGAADKHPDFLPEYYRLNNALSEFALIYKLVCESSGSAE